MKWYEEPFKGKKITVLGLGLLGRGVGDVDFLAKCGAEVLVTDKKNGSELAASVEKLKQYSNVQFKLGGHDPEDFKHCDMVLKAAGVRLDSPEVAVARAAGAQVAMSTALFAKYASEAGVKIVGVTGTRGKSTITHMIYHSLIRTNKRTVLGGNVRGLSTLALLPEVKAGDIAVLELDSWQLQGFGELKMSPHIAIFSNLMPDHQNYYKNLDEYFADKANIFRYQKPSDVLVVGQGIEARVRHANPPVEPLVPGALPADWTLQVPGEHNRHNAALAAAALLSLGLNSEQIRTGLESFEGVEGRLQLVSEKNGVKIYNDNNATTPEATVAALKALSGNYRLRKSIILIGGGSDKGLELGNLAAEICDSCKAVVLLSGTGSEKLAPLLDSRFTIHDSLSSAVQSALKLADAGDIVLFSPAFASFGMFKNEYERNDQFLALIAKL
ncbi:MAG: Mur ligase family protein [Patescibacteria group bacterium]